jgi:hypothetical protein
MVTLIITLIGAVASLAFKGVETKTESFLPMTIAAIGAAMAAMLVTTTTMSRRRFRTSFDGKHLFGTVERLVRTASQYSEHASRRLSDKFMFDLRLAEAEAVLQMYKELYMPRSDVQIARLSMSKIDEISQDKVSSSAGITSLK